MVYQLYNPETDRCYRTMTMTTVEAEKWNEQAKAAGMELRWIPETQNESLND